jgi:uncharacterized protein (TIGR02099 family)
MPRYRAVRVLKHGSLWIYRLTLYTLLASVALAVSGMLAVRYWLLPNIDQYRETISAAISRAAQQRIVIGAIEGDWRGLRPRLVLRDVRLYDAAGGERLALDAVHSTLSWATLIALEPRFYEIDLSGLAFEVRRDASGMLHVAGIALGGGDGGGLADWLLRQNRILLRDSEITWVDETLSGAPLALGQVQLEVDKLFRRHRFGLRAVPPLDLAAPLDVRGDLHITTLSDFAGWEGRVFFQVGYADLVALRQWVRVPLEIERGAGGLQVWMHVAAGALRSVTADVGLSDVRTRLRADLPQLELEQLHGRLAWTHRPGLLEFSAWGLSFTTPDGLRLAPADVRYRRSGTRPDAARYDVEFDALDLAAVTRLIDRLPVDETLRARLGELQPRGTVRGFHVSWRGSIKDGGDYSLRGGFENLAVNPSGYVPGFAAVSGSVDADQRGGSLVLRAGASQLALPKVFAEPLPLDSLNAKVAWSLSNGQPLVRLESVAFSNAHLEGRVAGAYQAQPAGPGRVDLAGALTRGDAREAWRYIPLVVNQDVRDWLRASLRSGAAAEVRMTLRGPLERFPFSDGSGAFEVVSKLDGVRLEFAPGWPALDGINGQLSVRGHHMTIRADQGQVFGVRLFGVRAVIPNLSSDEPLLQVVGEGEGPTADFLRFVEESPLDRLIDGFTRGLQASGRGGLRLTLDIPLQHSVDTRVSGRYRFADNVLGAAAGGPRLEQLGGVLIFSQDDVTLREATARLFGMPVRFVAERRPGAGVVIRGGGRADIAALSRELGLPGAGYLSGSTDWKATVSLVGRSYELVAESDLRGAASSLPAPLAKAPASALPLRVERRLRGPDQELLAFSLGEILSGQLARSLDASGRVLHGELRLAQAAPAPQRDGVWLAGQLEHLDFDAWRAVLSEPGAADSSALAGVDLRVTNLYAFSRNWKDLVVEARRADSAWQATLAGREAVGMLTWAPAGQGSLSGRFSRLHVPAVGTVLEEPSQPGARRELPSVNIVAEDFRMGERQLGRLALAAVPQGPDWRIETLDLRSPEGRVAMSGVWQMGGANPLTRMSLRLDVTDIGRYFARLQLPEGVKGGSGKLEGQLSWSGPPYALDLPSLSGKLALEAKDGQFVKVEPGIGKLIGVVSLQALPRRVSLDFRDVFSEGFRFDEIRSSAAIERGVVRTDDFHMVGTSARVEMKGQLDLARETQRLDVKVVPSLSEGVALGAAIVNPAVGLATLFAQKALKDPINQMAAFEYEITGTWADPVVAAKKREPASDAKQGRR